MVGTRNADGPCVLGPIGSVRRDREIDAVDRSNVWGMVVCGEALAVYNDVEPVPNTLPSASVARDECLRGAKRIPTRYSSELDGKN